MAASASAAENNDFNSYYKNGLLLLHQNKYEEALDELQTALTYDPQNPDILFGLGICFYQLKAFTDAYKSYDKAIFYYPSLSLKAQARSGIGDIYLQLGAYDEAIKEYNMVIVHKPKWPGVHLNLGMAWLKKGEYDNAIKEVKILLDSNPSLGEAYLLSSLIHLEKLDFSSSLTDLEKAFDLISPTIDIYYQLNRLYRLNNKYEKGVELIKNLIKNEKNKENISDSYNILGDSLFEWYQYLLKNKALNNEEPVTDVNNLLKDAVSHFKRSALIYPDEMNIRYKIGNIYALMNNLTDAQVYMKQAATLNPQKMDAGLELNQILWRNSFWSQAENMAEELTVSFPSNAETWINLYLIKQNLGKDKEALNVLKKALKRIPKNKDRDLTEEVKLKYVLGERYYNEGNTKEAFKTWKYISSNSPYSIYSDLIKVYSLIESRKYSDAAKILDDLKRKDYMFPKIYFLKGLLDLKEKKYDSALVQFKWADYMDKTDIKNAYYLGLAHSYIGQREEGRKIFRDILKVNINNNDARTAYLETFKDTSTPKPVNWKEQIVYFILIDRFNDGDKKNNINVDKSDTKGFHGGDIQGIIDKLDYLQSLGVTTLWLSPVFQNREEKFFDYSAYHGYWVTDFFNVDKHFGTITKLKELSDKLHARGMHLVLDMILNHMDYNSKFVDKHPDWFHSYPSIVNWDDQFQLENYMVSGLPDLAQEKADVKNFLFDMSKFWIDKVNPDGFRLDAVKHVPLNFWREYNNEMRKYAGNDFLLLGEILHGDPNYCKKYFNEGEFGSLFDFPLYYTMGEVFARGKSARQLGLRLYDDRKYNHADTISPILDNHDVERFINTCNGDIDKMKMGLSTILTVRGVPSVYYGTEIALPGGQEPDNRKDMIFRSTELTDYFRKLTHIRLGSPALTNGIQVQLYQDDYVYSFARVAYNEFAVVVLNNEPSIKQVRIPLYKVTIIKGRKKLKDSISDKLAQLNGNSINFDMAPRSCSIFIYKGGNYTNLIRIKSSQMKNPISRGLVEVDFRIKNVDLNEGENLYIIGGLEELGEWSADNAVGPMEKSINGDYVLKLQIPKGSISEYKYLKKGPDKSVSWQQRENMYLDLDSNDNADISDQW